MAYLNGRLPDSALAPIAEGRLRKDAAAAWNAMQQESQRRYGVTLLPLGGMSSYRTLAEQQYLYRTVRRGWAAYPGTSNHGWGLAVDLRTHQMRSIIDAIGAKYGWSKAWSDASWEWWHIRWREGVWKPGPTRQQIEAKALHPLGKRQRRAASRLLYHRRRALKEAKTGKGPRYHAQRAWRAFWLRRVNRLHRRASGERKKVLGRVLRAKSGVLK